MKFIEKIKIWRKVAANEGKANQLKASKNKIDKLAAHLLLGNPVTGRTMIELFNIYSYRDAIYDLGKKGYAIERKVVHSANGTEHVVWWFAAYTEEFVKWRAPQMFK